MKRASIILHALIICILIPYKVYSIGGASSRRPESSVYCSTEEDLLQQFCGPISFTQKGLCHFLRDIISHRAYAQEYLSYSFTHLIQFLEYGLKTNQKSLFIESTLRLFLNALKATDSVSCYAVMDITHQLPSLLKNSSALPPLLIPLVHENIKSALYETFIDKFQLFKTDIDHFFEEVTLNITRTLPQHTHQEELLNREKMCQMVVRFLETALLKTMWSAHDQEKAWDITKKISHNLSFLMDEGIITKDELDDLYKSLLESFCRFLKLSGSSLSDYALENIQRESHSTTLLLLCLEEQEEHLQTKRERLQEALMHLKARQLAERKGFLLNS